MTVYYVRKNGSDSNDGLSVGAAWLTIGHAEAAVTAGDTVYVGAGWYREMWTVTTSGSSGSPITFYADVTGRYTGDQPGRVVVTNCRADGLSVRSSALVSSEALIFRIWHNFIFYGGTANTVLFNTTSANAFEGVEFHRCSMLCNRIDADGGQALRLAVNEGSTPATAGLLLRFCTVHGIYAVYKSQAVDAYNLKILIERCVLFGVRDTLAYDRSGNAASPNYTAGGITIRNCLFQGTTDSHLLYADQVTNTTYPIIIEDCISYGPYMGNSAIFGNTAAKTAVITRRLYAASGTSVSETYHTVEGGSVYPRLVDVICSGWDDYGIEALFNSVGIFHPVWSMVPIADRVDPYGITSARLSSVLDATGKKGGLLPMNIPFAGTVTDPDSKWSNEANAVDMNMVSNASCSTNGSASSNYIQIAGTTSLGSFDPGAIGKVVARAYLRHGTSATGYAGGFQVATSGNAEVLGTLPDTGNLYKIGEPYLYFDLELTAPAGGWSKSVIENLELRVWRTAGTIYTLMVHAAHLLVWCENAIPAAPSAVDYFEVPAVSTAQHNTGAASVNLHGYGMVERTIPAASLTYTITVQARKDSNYAGSQPNMELVDVLTGSVLASDAMTGGANTWEELTLSYAFASAATVCLRLRSHDANPAGNCWFDDLEIEKA